MKKLTGKTYYNLALYSM